MNTHILTGYSDSTLLFLNPPSPGIDLEALLEKYVDTTKCIYDEVNELPAESSASIYKEMLHRSSLFGQLPWLTALADTFESPSERIQETIAALHKDFSHALQSSDENSRAYCGALRGEIPSSVSTRSYPHVASRLLTIRLVDIFSALSDSSEVCSNVVHPPIVVSGLKNLSLEDWVETFKQAAAALHSSKADISGSKQGTKFPITLNQSKSRDLYMFWEENERKSQSFQIYANVGLACLAIRRLLQGRLDNPWGEKEAAEEFGEGLPAPSHGWSSLSRPLELAIAIGPLILFSPKKLSSNHISRARLAQLWIERGKCRNDLVWSVEKEIWRGLFKIADGASIEVGIQEMVSKMPPNVDSPAARRWYNLEEHTSKQFQNPKDSDFFRVLQMDAFVPQSMSAFTITPRPLQRFQDAKDLTSGPFLPWTVDPAPPNKKLIQPETPPLTPPPPAQLRPSPPSPSPPLPAPLRPSHLPFAPLRPSPLSPRPPLPLPPLLQDSPPPPSPSTPQHALLRASPLVQLAPFPPAPALSATTEPCPTHEGWWSQEEAMQPPVSGILGTNEGLDMIEVDSETIPPNAALTQLAEGCGRPCVNQTTGRRSRIKSLSPRSTSPRSTEDPGADEGAVEPHLKRRRHNPKPAPLSGSSRVKKRSVAKPLKIDQLPKSSRFEDMREIAVRDITEEYHRPIFDVERLDITSQPPKVRGERNTTFSIPGSEGSYEWIPQFHFQRDLDLFYNMHDASKNAHPSARGYIATFTYDKYKSMNADVLLEILRKQHVVITDRPIQSRKFDEAGLVRLGALTKRFTVHDHSIDESFSEYWQEDGPTGQFGQQKSGTLLQILRAASHPDGKALNGLGFPRSAPAEIDLRFSTDSIAWDQVHGEEWCVDDYPTAAVRWGLCATAGAYHRVHFDCEGFGTFVYPESGVKIWMIGVPKHGKTFDDLASIDCFLSDEFSLDAANSHLVDWVALSLMPGTTLIMRPNTLHVVFTAENSVCMGGHYFSTPTLRDTCYGMYHSFLVGRLLTNDEHNKHAFMFLARIVAFYKTSLMGSEDPEAISSCDEKIDKMDWSPDDPRWHLPDLASFDGILDVCSLFCLLELGNALAPWSYGEKNNAERRRLMYARKRARILRHWIFKRYKLLDKNNNIVDYKRAFYWPYLSQIACALVGYTRNAHLKGVEHRDFEKECTEAAVLKVIEGSLQHHQELWRMYCDARAVDSLPVTFAWKGPWFQIQKAEGSLTVEVGSDDEEGFNLDDACAFVSRRFAVPGG